MEEERLQRLSMYDNIQVRIKGWIRRCRRFIRSKLNPPPAKFQNKRDLINLIHRASAATKDAHGKSIFILTMRGWANHVALESILGARLRLDGHKVTFLLCEESVPFCMYGSVNMPPAKRRNCTACVQSRFSVVEGNFPVLTVPSSRDLEHVFFSEVDGLNLAECIDFEYRGAPYGQLVRPSVIWFLRRSRLNEEDAPIYRKAIISAHTVRQFLETLIAELEVDAVVGLNGDFLIEKTAGWVLQQHGIRWVTYDYAFNEYVLVGLNASCWDDLAFDSSSQFSTADLAEEELCEAEHLLGRWRKKGGWQGDLYWSRPQEKFRNRSGEFDSEPYAVAFTNLTFESSVIGKERVFADQFEWLNALIRFFTDHSDYHLVMRIHPAEVRDSHWRPRESLYAFLADEWCQLPSNVSVVAPQDETSSYALAESASAVLVYSSNIGMEMVDRGKLVITAAHSHYAGRGFTVDPGTEAGYFDAIARVMQKPQMHPLVESRKQLVDYVAWLFSRRLIRFEPLSKQGESWPAVNPKTPEEVASPENEGLDKLCALVVRGEVWW